MKSVSFIFLLLIMVVLSSCDDRPEGRYRFNDGWKFKILHDESNVQSMEFLNLQYDDTEWEAVSLPHTANIEPLVVNDQWQGNCWYRKIFKIPDSFKDKKIIIELEAAMNHSKIWVNGLHADDHNGGYLPVVMDVTDLVTIGEENVIAIRLNNTDNAITGPKPLNILDFNMYGGLYRNAWLIADNEVHISHPVLADKVAGGGIFITTPEVSHEKSVVDIKTHLLNEGVKPQKVEVIHSLFFGKDLIQQQSSGILDIAGDGELDVVKQFAVDNSQLWSPDAPNLYNVETEVLVDGTIVDQQKNRFGIREFIFKDNELYINGEKTFLRGVNRHQEYPFIGYALSDNAQYRDAKKIKEAGFDFVRLSHYPQSTAFMEACDGLGLIVLDAILGWQYYIDNEDFREYCYRSAKELIFRDRNHPSVLAWEVSLNETQMPIFFMEKLHEIVHAQYPDENVYSCGWKDDVYDIFLQARQHRILHPKSVIEKPYVVSEYGDWEYYSRNAGLNQHQYSRDIRYAKSSRQKRGCGEARLLQQATNVQEAHNDNFRTPAFADGYWVMYDYNRGYDDDIEYSGVSDIFRIPKFAYYFFKSQRSLDQDTTIHIASYWNEKSPLDVRVFSNCEEIALYLDDDLIAKQKPDVNNISDNLNHPPFTFNLDAFSPGTLRAVGLVNGEKVGQHMVTTPSDPARLKVWIDESGKKPQSGCNDVLFLYIAAVDENGTIVPDFSGEVELNEVDNIEVINVGEVKAEAGIATALLRIGDVDGVFTVSASADNGLNGLLEFQVY